MIGLSVYSGFGRQYRNLKLEESFHLDGGTMRIDLGSDATGDLYYRNAAGLTVRLGIGAAGQILTAVNGLPVWAAPPSDGNQNSYTFSTGLTNNAGTITANLSTGIAGGQSVTGGTAAGENLTLVSTTHATKGKIITAQDLLPPANNTTNLGAGTTRFANVYALNVSAGGSALALKSTASDVGVVAGNIERMRVMGTGSTVFQAGGVFTDEGYLVDVKGSLRTTGVNTLGNLAGTGNRMVVAGPTGILTTQNIPTGVSYTAGTGISIANGVITNTITNTNQLVNSAGFISSAAHTHGIANAAGAQQFTFAIGENIRFAGSGGTSASFDAATKTVTFTSSSGIVYSAGSGIAITNGAIINTRTNTSHLTNDSGFLTTNAHIHTIANSAGTAQFNFGVGEAVRFAGANGNSVSFDSATKTITITAPTPSGGTTYTAGAGIAISGGNVISNTRTHTSHLTNDSGFLTSLAHVHNVYNAVGTLQFSVGVNEGIRFEGVTFDPSLKKITVAAGSVALPHTRVAFGSPTNTVTHSPDLIFDQQSLWINGGNVVSGGLSVDGANHPAIMLRSSGTIRGMIGIPSANGGYLADSLLGDIAIYAPGRFIVGSGPFQLAVAPSYVQVKSLGGIGTRFVAATANGTLTIAEPSVAHTHGIANTAGVRQFVFAQGEDVRFEGGQGIDVTFDAFANKVRIATTTCIRQHVINLFLDGELGWKRNISIPNNCTITKWRLTIPAFTHNTWLEVDVRKSTFSDYPSTTSIVGAGVKPRIGAQRTNEASPSGWTTTVLEGDGELQFVVHDVTPDVTWAKIALFITETCP